VEQPLLDRPEEDKHRQDQDRREDRRNVEAETDGHPDRRHHPDRRCGGQTVHLVALAEDGACAKEPDPCDDLGRDTRRICWGAEDLEPEPREQARPDADQAEGLDPCRVAVELALETDRDREDRRNE
jgi:hypothetical protein